MSNYIQIDEELIALDGIIHVSPTIEKKNEHEESAYFIITYESGVKINFMRDISEKPHNFMDIYHNVRDFRRKLIDQLDPINYPKSFFEQKTN